MNLPDFLTDPLRQRGFRLTPQRLAILQALHQGGSHQSPGDIVRQTQTIMPGISEPTVYRTLGFLVQEGLVQAAATPAGRLEYELAGRQHHHLVCRRCGSTAEIGHELIQPFFTQLHRQTGFRIDALYIVFSGLCPNCLSPAAMD
jgi:Fe2+ or Zn2+ uptake regulation protein